MTHTPTPWEIVSRLVGPLVIVSGDTEVAHVGADSFELASANAAHIVKCVNLHDELVKAFELLIDNITPEAWEALPHYVQEEVMQTYNNAKGEASHA